MADSPSQSSGKTLKLLTNSGASKAVVTTEASSVLRLRGRGIQCNGAPKVTVSVDGTRELIASLSNRRYTTYSAAVKLPAGRHAVKVRFVNAHRSSTCDRRAHVDSVVLATKPAPAASTPKTAPVASAPKPAPVASAPKPAPVASAPKPAPVATAPTPAPVVTAPKPAPAAPAVPDGGTTIFDSDFANRGLSAYANVFHREKMSVVNDPVLGSARKAVKMTIADSDTGPTENPRGQLETSHFWDEGEEYYVGLSAMFGDDWNWRMGATSWVTFHQVYGPPYVGQGPTNLNVKTNNSTGQPRITWERTSAFNYDHPFEVPLVQKKWFDIVWHEKLSRDPKVGFVEMWINTGSGYQRIPLKGQERLYMATKTGANGSTTDGNSSNIALYRELGVAASATMYFADHRVGTTFDSAAPRSYR